MKTYQSSFNLLPLLLGLFLVNPASAATVPYVIQISVDGLRADTLQSLITESPESFPNFVRLQTEGAYTYNARCDYDYSVTVPNHASMVTGRPVVQPAGQPDTTHHGFNTNFPQPNDTLHSRGNTNLSYICSTFDVVHDHGLSTAFYVGKTRLSYIRTSYNDTFGAPDATGEDNGRNKIDFSIVQNGNTPALIHALATSLSNAPVNYTFLHITDPDSAGHGSGFISMVYEDSVVATDNYLGQIFEAIDANPALAGKTALTLTADHGGGGGNPNNHTDATRPENFLIPFFLWAPGVDPGSDLYNQFLNRFDPASDRPDYDSPVQPIRDGDAPNLSLTLLGLPPVPGSFMLPELASAGISLSLSQVDDGLILSWPSSPSGFILETIPDLPATSWQKITQGILDDGEVKTLTVNLASASSSYYRLRNPAFTITSQPQPVAVHPGTAVTFSVSANAPGALTYQWQLNGSDIPDANHPSLTLNNTQIPDAGDYTVILSDGLDSLTSDPATLTTLVIPSIVQLPASQTVNVGDSVTFTVIIAGNPPPFGYKWRRNNLAIDIQVSDELTSTLTLTNVQPSHAGNYDVIITNSAFSSPGILTRPAAILTVE